MAAAAVAEASAIGGVGRRAGPSRAVPWRRGVPYLRWKRIGLEVGRIRREEGWGARPTADQGGRRLAASFPITKGPHTHTQRERVCNG